MHPTNRLRELRKRAGLTQIELATAAGVSQAAISQLENDSRTMTLEWMRAFARVIGCSVADLLTDQDNPDRLTTEEAELIQNFRNGDTTDREMIRRVAAPITTFRLRDNDAA